MPARVRKIRHDEDTRLKIKVGNIINRLQKHVDGEIEMTPTQIAAAKILLGKTLPDLSSQEISGEVTHAYVARIPPAAKSTDEWLSLSQTSVRNSVSGQTH